MLFRIAFTFGKHYTDFFLSLKRQYPFFENTVSEGCPSARHNLNTKTNVE